MSEAVSMTHIRRILRDHIPDGDEQTFELTLELARHAALPAALNAELLHLLRINFVPDAPQTAEADLLLSPLCSEIGDDLFEIEAGVRNTLLRDLTEHHPRDGRLQHVAELLSQYNRRFAPWTEQPELALAQRVTALNFLNPARVRAWIAEAEQALGGTRPLERAWFIAMQQEIERVEADVRIRPVHTSLPEQTVVSLLNALRGEFPETFIMVLVYDPGQHTLTLDPASEEFYKIEWTHYQPINLATDGRIGIAGRAARISLGSGQPNIQLVGDVTRDPDYLMLDSETRSELAVPLMHDQELLGVLTLESTQVDAFGDANIAFVRQVCALVERRDWPGPVWWPLVAHECHQKLVIIQNIVVLSRLQYAPGKQALLTAINDLAAQAAKHSRTVAESVSALDVLTISGLVGDIRYHVQMLDRRVEGDAPQQIQRIELIAGELAHLILDNPYIRSESMGLDAWLQGQMEQLVEVPEVRLAFDLRCEDVMVKVSPVLLRSALNILVSNAIEAMNSSGRIDVRTQWSGTTAEITIADTGPGIPEDMQQRLFHERISMKNDGSGMGLLLARAALESLGGGIEVRSSSPQGTTFALTLPIENAPAQVADTSGVQVAVPQEHPAETVFPAEAALQTPVFANSMLSDELAMSALPLDLLAERALQAERDRYKDDQAVDSRFGYELFRRALAEESADAFAYVYHLYEPQVLKWVDKHSRFGETGESADFFASSALSTFYFALRGPKFEKFSSLRDVMSYLRLCVHTVIAQYIRDQRATTITSLDAAAQITHTPDLGTRVDLDELWANIHQLLPDPRYQLLAHALFIQGLKPREIVQAYSSQWSNEHEVAVAKYRILRVLRRDPQLQAYAQGKRLS